ncbi:M17 family metallopeptidase [Blastomonas sp.]|uniref:leucyl aminopeptidase family protein n=1 Tax=Blastomonas sp. TaxID=1909299 RepID=UPI00263710B6|nr:leucyl aminopeptidase [Blastomonas sp.]MDM7956273.1 leucyl aminopeptidase [Blastomonas sp.]
MLSSRNAISAGLSIVLSAAAWASPVIAQTRSADAVAPSLTLKAARQQQRAVAFVAAPAAMTGTLVLPLASETDLATRASALSEAERSAVARALGSAEFDYATQGALSLRGIGGWDRIHVVSTGSDMSPAALQKLGTLAGRALMKDKGPVTVLATGLPAEAAAEIATGMGIGEYRSDIYNAKALQAEAMAGTSIVTDAADGARTLYEGRGKPLVEAMAFARDLSNEPGNVVYPESFVERARAAFSGVPGVSIEVLDVPAMERLGMGSILGSGRGSARPPRMLIVRYAGRGAPSGGPVVLAGKGITFDSGGISIKNSGGMGDMKFDMSGAASVVGAVLALSKSRAPVDVVAVAALSENMPDGNAARPSDVLQAMNGKTIEIISTDAEGRLVLADAVAYADARLNPAAIVDIATLTGSIVTALGDDYAGLFSRHSPLADQLLQAGEKSGDALWRMPLHPSYAEDTKSTIADIKNSGASGAGAGAGAHFIGAFIKPETPWAHIDIAGMAWGSGGDTKAAGSTGYGVRLLEAFVRDFQPVPKVAAEE